MPSIFNLFKKGRKRKMVSQRYTINIDIQEKIIKKGTKKSKIKIRLLNYTSELSKADKTTQYEKSDHYVYNSRDDEYIMEYVTTFYKKKILKQKDILLKTRITNDNTDNVKNLKKEINKYYDNFKYFKSSGFLWEEKTNKYITEKMKEKDKKLLKNIEKIASKIPLGTIDDGKKIIEKIRKYEEYIKIKKDIDHYRKEHDKLINGCNGNFFINKKSIEDNDKIKNNDEILIILFYIGSPYYMRYKHGKKLLNR